MNSRTNTPIPDFATLRKPDQVMRLARMGSAHPTRLSFMRTLLRHLKKHQWSFDRPRFDINSDGSGIATYRALSATHVYTLVAFSHQLDDDKRSDRVIAEAWDATFTLIDGEATQADIDRLQVQVPLQEAGRISEKELVLSRANRSVRLFNYVLGCLCRGQQPTLAEIEPIGYLMRTTAVYGAGKFGAADRARWQEREEFKGSFQPELLSVWLIRWFAVDLVEHLASLASERAVKLEPEIRRSLGIGNSTGLGMAPFLINHPALIHSWVYAKETALKRVRSVRNTSSTEIELFKNRLSRMHSHIKQWQSQHPIQKQKIQELTLDLAVLERHLTQFNWHEPYPWNSLIIWSESSLSLEGQELLVALVMEPHGNLIDDLSSTMAADESENFAIDGTMSVGTLKSAFKQTYGWAENIDFSEKSACARVWYVSANKLEPRLGERFEEPIEPYEQALCPARDASRALESLQTCGNSELVAEFLLAHPEHRHIVRRVQQLRSLAYGEIQDNTISSSMLPIDLLRCKLAFFGARKFDPRSDRWVRITMYQDAPYPYELDTMDPDDLAYPGAT